MSISQNLPSTRPTLNLNFARSKTLDPRITFTRSSSATCVDKDGLIKTVLSNRPRFTYNGSTGESLGMLLEEARTNLATYSSNFNNTSVWGYSSAYVIPNSGLAPDNTYTAYLYRENGTNGHRVQQNYSAVNGTSYTFSCFFKNISRRYAFIGSQNFNSFGATFDLISGTTSTQANTSSTITPLSNGWYLCSITFVANTTVGSVAMFGSNNGNNGNNSSYVLDGNTDLYIWGAQIEVGSFPTSYIPTTPTFTSRASSATFYDSSGILQTAGTNVARSNAFLPDSSGVFRSAGLLLEEARTNLCERTEEFDNSYFDTTTGCTVVPNAAVAPDGTFTADLLREDTSTGIHSRFRYGIYTMESGLYFTSSVFVKPAGRTTVTLEYRDNIHTVFNLQTLTVSGGGSGNANLVSSSITPLPNGWYRLTATSLGVGPYNSGFGVGMYGGGNRSYTGDGTSGVYVWGLQIENASFATSYIPSRSSFTSRASSATYYDVNGFLRTAAVNEARSNAFLPDSSGVFRSIGLLYEGAATNLATHSEQLSSWGNNGNGITITTNSEIAPDGTLTADRLSQSSVTNANRTLFNPASTVRSGQILTTSFWMKKVSGTDTEPSISVCGIGGGPCQTITVTSDWKRYTYTFTAINDGGNYEVGSINIGWNLNGAANNNVYALWGFQVEVGSTATSYIPTTNATVTRSADVVSSSTTTRAADVSSSAAVTRAADSASITGTNFTNFYNPLESTLLTVGEENLHKLSSSALTLSSDAKLNSTVTNVLYYPKTIQYASLKEMGAYPAIISDGLVLNLDAGVRKSYIGSGTTWRDLSGNGNTGTLTNGPTFSSSNGGSIVFDGVNDWASFSSNSSYNVGTGDFSAFCWMKSNNKSDFQTLLSLDNAATGNGILFYTAATSGVFRTWIGGSVRNGSIDICNNVWNFVGVTRNSGTVTQYINSISNGTYVASGSVSANQNLRLGSYGSGFYLNGNIAQASIYNRALTATEIQQNFNATRRRYGI